MRIDVRLLNSPAIERKLDEISEALAKLRREIMTAISDFAAKQNEFNTRIGSAIDGIVGDIKSLNDKITELQNSSGAVTPEDQALIDDLQAQGQALADRAEALDAQTPPAPPAG